MYKVLEQFVDRSIPLWNEALSWFHSRIRIDFPGNGNDEDWTLPEGLKYNPNGADEAESPDVDSDLESEDARMAREMAEEELKYDDNYRDWKKQHRILIQCEPRDFIPALELNKDIPALSLREKFANSGLQIIFKLANIHLTPENPSYDGGSWHVEGALNEHICATALYYYDQENITESSLAFRQSVDAEAMVSLPEQVSFPSHPHTQLTP